MIEMSRRFEERGLSGVARAALLLSVWAALCLAPTLTIAQDLPGWSVRKLKMRANTGDLGNYAIQGEIDTIPTPNFKDDVLAAGFTVTVESQLGEVISSTIDPAICVDRRGSIRCVDPETKSKAIFRKRIAPDFFRVLISLKRVTFTQPSPDDIPMNIRIHTIADMIDREDSISECVAVSKGRTLRCKERP
jgi:hypothetical protein